MTDVKSMKLVELVWVDASGTHGWLDEVEDDLLSECHVIGYLHHLTKDSVVLVRGYNDTDVLMDAIAVPRGAVVSGKVLK